MLLYYTIIVLMLIIILFLSLTLYILLKKNVFFSKKEKEFIIFTIEIFEEYGNDLGIQSADQHKKLVDELKKIKKKLNESND